MDEIFQHLAPHSFIYDGNCSLVLALMEVIMILRDGGIIILALFLAPIVFSIIVAVANDQW